MFSQVFHNQRLTFVGTMTILAVFNKLRSRVFDALILGVLTLLFTAEVSGLVKDEQSLQQYKVWLDGREIGTHRVTVDAGVEKTRVTTEVDYQVKVLFVKVFDYRHVAQEVWRGDCLTELASETVTNGRQHELRVESRNNDAVVVRATEKPQALGQELPSCLGSFAYWDLSKLKRDSLMNSQTGEMSRAELSYIGESMIPKTTVTARQYLLKTAVAQINLWYDDDDQWVGLETDADGKRLVYVEQSRADSI